MKSFNAPAPDLNGKSILVTGGTGSFGKAFVQTVLQRYKPRKLIIFSRDELKQYEMAHEYSQDNYPCLRYFIGDVRDRERLAMAMRDVEYVIHAAALKHVPIAEYNPFECIQTNVHGAENVVNAALATGVKRVIALSTDKAVSPLNLYGASKLAADKIFVAANNLSGKSSTRFAVVRYGNVVGSRGSVITLYERLVREGADSLPITDPRMTRFWITLDQGASFVMSRLDKMVGGEIFVPKIPSMNIMDLARAIAPECRTEVVGIRPGEKLHEIMVAEDDARHTVEQDDCYVIRPPFHEWDSSAYARQGGGKPCPDGFNYCSDTNTQWLTVEQLRKMAGLTDEAAGG